jgi:hypothetical protein
MLFDRQRRLLALLDAVGGNIGSLDFQKLLFLYCQEADEMVPYEFVPYKFGGFSFTSYADKRRLIERGLLQNEEHAWILTEDGRDAATVTRAVQLSIDQFTRRHARLRGDALVAEAYRRYPYYASRSEIAERILANDPSTLNAIDKLRPKTGLTGLCTVGYEGRSLEGYLNLLIRSGVTLLCDVRRNPWSRKYGFSKSTLAKGCEGVGIHYEHLPELGIASEDRRGLETQEDYDALFFDYKRYSLPFQEEALKKIKRWVKQGQRVALTCFERRPEQCHRHCVAEALEKGFGRQFKPVHL